MFVLLYLVLCSYFHLISDSLTSRISSFPVEQKTHFVSKCAISTFPECSILRKKLWGAGACRLDLPAPLFASVLHFHSKQHRLCPNSGPASVKDQSFTASKGRVLQRDLQAASACCVIGRSTLCSISWLRHQMFPPRPAHHNFWWGKVRESDKKSKVWLSDLFELQEVLISFFNPSALEEEKKRLWFISCWEDRGEVNLLLNPQ